MQRNNPIINEFYQSKEWKKCRRAYVLSKYNICERCGNTEPKMIVHHKIEINERNVGDTNITLDFSNLELLCLTCHNKQHFDKKRYEFDEEGNLKTYKGDKIITV